MSSNTLLPVFGHNSQTILYQFAEEQRIARAPESSFAEYWEFFCAGIITRKFTLSDDQISEAVVGAGADGGIDLIYTFVDGELVTDTFDTSDIKSGAKIQLLIGQAKTSQNFSEDGIGRLTSVTRDLLSLSTNESDFSDVYNEDVRRAFQLFRSSYRRILTHLPTLSISYFYCANRAPNQISSGIKNRVEGLRSACLEKFPDAHVDISLMGASELWSLASERRKQTYSLGVQRVTPGKKGYIALVKIGEINAFLRKENGEINQEIFDSNVRYHLNSTPVNKSISQSLTDDEDIEFWWLNNGITIIGSTVSLSDDTLTIRDPQIVNGLQTSIEIARYFDRSPHNDEERAVLVKTISVEDDETRYKIIRATNNQNPVSLAMLRATDDFQRNLESFLLAKGLFYERRKGFYAAQRKPIISTFSLTFLAQAVISALHRRPDTARARPSDPISNDSEYLKIFDNDKPLEMYYKVAVIARQCEVYLKRKKELRAKEVNNLRFYVLMYLAWKLSGTSEPSATDLAEIDLSKANDDLMATVYDAVDEAYQSVGGDDDAAKGSLLKGHLAQRYSTENNTIVSKINPRLI